MALPSSGALSLLNIRTQFGAGTTAGDGLAEYYAGASLVSAGTRGISGAIPNLIKQSLGIPSDTKVDWCITEDFFTEIFDQECLDIAASLRVLGNNIVHYISPKPSEHALQIPVINMRNWKTKEEWENFLSPDTIIMR